MNTTYRSLSNNGHAYTIASGRQIAISNTHSHLVAVFARQDAARLIRSLRNDGYTSQRLDSMGYPVSRS